MSEAAFSTLSGGPTGLDGAAVTHCGAVRALNEDSYLVTPWVCLVADGMGGHESGEVASKAIVDRFAAAASEQRLDLVDLEPLLAEINSEVYEAALLAGTDGMGSTLVGVALVDNGGEPSAVVFNVGDSRCYRLVGDDFSLLTTDHSHVQELVDAGKIAAQDAASHPLRNVVTRAIGPEASVVADFIVLADRTCRLLLCSDGVSGELDDDVVHRIVASGNPPDATALELIEEVLTGTRTRQRHRRGGRPGSLDRKRGHHPTSPDRGDERRDHRTENWHDDVMTARNWGTSTFIPGDHDALAGPDAVGIVEHGQPSTRSRLWALIANESALDDVLVNGDKRTAKEFAHAKRVDIHTEPISNAETKGASQAPDVKFSFLALAQRKTEMSTGEMLHPFTHHVFGTPLLLRVVDLEGYSGRDLYDLVAKRMRNFVPKSALRFLTDHKDDPRQEDDYEEKTEDSALMPRAGSRKRRHRTTTDMEEVAAGPVPRYGFRLRLASRDGRRCALCPWYECCIGCLVPDDDYPTIVTCGDSIVIDWHFAVDIATSGFGFRPNQLDYPSGQTPVRAKQFIVPVKNHGSYGNGAKKRGGNSSAVTLEQCLDAFAEEERIPEVCISFDVVWASSLVLDLSHSFMLNICAGLLLSMSGLSSADKAHESLAVTTSRHYSFEALPVYTACTPKTERLGYFSD